MWPTVPRIKVLALLSLVAIVTQGCSDGSKSPDAPASTMSESVTSKSSITGAVSVESQSEPVPLSVEDFDVGDSDLFWTGRDELLSSEVVGGALHVSAIDNSRTQTLRSTWPPLTAVTFESDITIDTHTLGLFSAGCWSGQDSYALAFTGDRRLAVVARTFEGDPSVGGNAPLESLAELGRTSLIPSVGIPFRVRVSCFQQDGAGWISAWIDDQPVALVELPGEVGRFDAVGYEVAVAFENAGLVIDNVEISEGYAGDGSHPSMLPPVTNDSTATVFNHDGVSFEFPSNWVYFEEVAPLFEIPGAWSFGVSPDGESNMMSLSLIPDQVLAEAGMTPDQFIEALIEVEESQGLSLRSEPSTLLVGAEEGVLLEFDAGIGPRTGKPLMKDNVWIFTDIGAYLFTFQYLPNDEPTVRPVWERALETAQGLDQ